MIYLELFFTFLKIGAISFGGGYAMISPIREQVLSHGWLTEEELLNMIAVAESTPGPIAVNMATFVGATQGGIPGSLMATLGVVLPSFIIILLIAALVRSFLKYPAVQAFLSGVRPCVVGLILGTSATLFLTTLLGFATLGQPFSIDWRGVGILAVVAGVDAVYKKFRRKKPSPIILILTSAILGILLYPI